MFALLALGSVSGGGCGSGSPAGGGDTAARICTPDAYVFCLCSDGSHGTKQCNEEGTAFSTCGDCEGRAGAGGDGLGGFGGDPIGGAGGSGLGGSTGGKGGSSGTTGGSGGATGGSGGAGTGGTASTGGTGGTAGKGGSGGGQSGSGGAGASGAGGKGGSAGGTAGTGGSGPGNDACPGTVVAVVVGSETSLADSTAGAKDDVTASCAKGTGPDVVYQVMPQTTGTLTIKVQGQSSMNPAVYAWTGACGSGAPAGCVDATGAGGLETVSVPATAGTPVYVAVDSDGAGGAFALTLSLVASVDGDKCPGQPIKLDPGSDQTINGDTSFAKADYVGAAPCDKSNSTPDVVYSVTATASGTLTAKLSPTGSFDGTLYVRSGTCTTGPQVGCSESAGPAGAETVSFQATADTTYSVFVDGKTGSFGAFSLSLALSAGGCGDKIVQPNEQCDDGNTASDDGCVACKVEANPSFADCPGLPVHVFGPATTVSGSTASYTDFDQGSCGGGSAKDRFYQVVPEKTGTLHAVVTSASFDAVLYARTTCLDTSKEVACSDVIGKGGESFDVAVTAGTPIWIAVDGYQTQSGTFDLELSIQ